jgi:TetR/AcrR family transcriptional regulator, regulator of cefoperazone and chloramphenicol sensitivity
VTQEVLVAAAAGEPTFEDLTGRARIRDAALRLFDERGIDGTTVRDIARAAGVSSGLIRHHFGSKEGLRAACDSHVLAQMMRLKEEAILGGQLGNAGFFSAAQPAVLAMLRYYARSMLDRSPTADAMFEEVVGLAERWLEDYHPAEMADPTAYAALLVAMELGALAMREQLSRALGADIFSPEGHLRLARARLDFYSKPLLSAELAEKGHAALNELQEQLRRRERSRAEAPGDDDGN